MEIFGERLVVWKNCAVEYGTQLCDHLQREPSLGEIKENLPEKSSHKLQAEKQKQTIERRYIKIFALSCQLEAVRYHKKFVHPPVVEAPPFDCHSCQETFDKKDTSLGILETVN